jgi:hypothetical protein
MGVNFPSDWVGTVREDGCVDTSGTSPGCTVNLPSDWVGTVGEDGCVDTSGTSPGCNVNLKSPFCSNQWMSIEATESLPVLSP